MSNIVAFRSPEHKDVYSNNQRIAVSPSDITIVFSRLGEGGIVPAVEDLVTVRLSPYQFKTFAGVLMNALEAWEETFGEIPSMQAPMTVESLKAAMEAMKAQLTVGAEASPKPADTPPKKRTSKKD